MQVWKETHAPIVNDILNSAVFHSTHASIRRCMKSLHVLHFCTLDSFLNYAPDYVVDALRSGLFGDHTISEIIALLKWRQQVMHKLISKHSMRKRSQPEKKSIKTDTVVSQRIQPNRFSRLGNR